MRRGVGLVLIGLGAFLIVVALMTAFYIPGQLIKFPVDKYAVTTLTGSNVDYFSAKDSIVLSGVNVKSTMTTRGDVAASSVATAVWESFTSVMDTTNNTPISYAQARTPINRRTGVLVNCCGAYVGTATTVHLAGQGPVWPIGTQPKNYQVFDTTLLKPVTFAYAGTASIDGDSTYKFVEHVSNQRFGSQSVPGSLVGEPNQAAVTAQEYLTEDNTYYVDPASGTPVDVIETQARTLDVGGVARLTVFRGTLAETPTSTASAVHTAQHFDSQATLLEVIVPLVSGLVGLLVLVFGVLLARSQRERDEPAYDEEPIETPA